jgi:hypothetical protein
MGVGSRGCLNLFCKNCGKPIRAVTGVPYCGCRIYGNSKPLSYVLIKTVNQKVFVRGQLWVVAQNGSVALINSQIEITLIKTTGDKIHVAVDGERLGAAEYVSLPPFVEKLLHASVEKQAHKVTVIAGYEEARRILSSTPGATLREVEGERAVVTVPI